MAKVIVWNPSPRKKKALDREQVAKRQAKAVRFLRDVTDDPDLADEIESLSIQEYAERKGFELLNNPMRKKKGKPMKKDEMKEAVRDGVAEALKGAKDIFRETRRNSNGQQPATTLPAASTGKAADSDRGKILARVDDAAAALADGDEDEALDILNGLLDDFDE